MRYFVAAVLFLISIICSAAIYMQIDKNGNISYSDMPSPGAQQVDIANTPAMQVSEPTTSAAKSNSEASKEEKTTAIATVTEPNKPYTDFSISSPTDQQTFQNQREIPIELATSPALQPGDKVVVFLDGAQIGEPAASTHFMLHQVNRGSHQISAKLIDKQQTTLKVAPAITIYIHYAALGGEQS